jgi:hypothetical protein
MREGLPHGRRERLRAPPRARARRGMRTRRDRPPRLLPERGRGARWALAREPRRLSRVHPLTSARGRSGRGGASCTRRCGSPSVRLRARDHDPTARRSSARRSTSRAAASAPGGAACTRS